MEPEIFSAISPGPEPMRRVALAALVFAIAACLVQFRPWSTRSPPAAVTTASRSRIDYPADRLPFITLPDGERRVVRSLLNVDRRMRYGDYRWDDRGIPAGPTWVRVDLARQTLSLFRAGHEIGTAVVIYGTDGKPTPRGVFPILEKDRDHRSTLYDAAMPFMLRLTGDGVAIHASDVRYGHATHGCIGVPPAFARRLFEQVKRRDPVAIVAA